MIYENLSGSGTGFTIANAPINSDLFFLVFLGHFCTRVASSPGVGEYTLSGTTLTLGFTKDTGDELYCWSETLATRALLVGTVSGAKNGSNKNFTLSESIPSGTEPILVHNGMPLNPTGTGTNHYARTGGGFTLDAAHPAPDVGDQLDIYVAVTGAASGLFHILTLSGACMGRYSPSILSMDRCGTTRWMGTYNSRQWSVSAPIVSRRGKSGRLRARRRLLTNGYR